ncbi:hypothetical protein DMB68_13430 [Flavobacterium hydrophilum]|uniref:Uncharacterized protein n=1 Tax=Flavobacterium hydrophilum TaxID=2211445 RepID=A0A2V4CEI7_9FLAO|nr:hypothetical protein DMB68_13430 [Flavobacterium hydrophilum]
MFCFGLRVRILNEQNKIFANYYFSYETKNALGIEPFAGEAKQKIKPKARPGRKRPKYNCTNCYFVGNNYIFVRKN